MYHHCLHAWKRRNILCIFRSIFLHTVRLKIKDWLRTVTELILRRMSFVKLEEVLIGLNGTEPRAFKLFSFETKLLIMFYLMQNCTSKVRTEQHTAFKLVSFDNVLKRQQLNRIWKFHRQNSGGKTLQIDSKTKFW